jgi:hypothetical protein
MEGRKPIDRTTKMNAAQRMEKAPTRTLVVANRHYAELARAFSMGESPHEASTPISE